MILLTAQNYKDKHWPNVGTQNVGLHVSTCGPQEETEHTPIRQHTREGKQLTLKSRGATYRDPNRLEEQVNEILMRHGTDAKSCSHTALEGEKLWRTALGADGSELSWSQPYA